MIALINSSNGKSIPPSVPSLLFPLGGLYAPVCRKAGGLTSLSSLQNKHEIRGKMKRPLWGGRFKNNQ
jgi:hypothetical protein